MRYVLIVLVLGLGAVAVSQWVGGHKDEEKTPPSKPAPETPTSQPSVPEVQDPKTPPAAGAAVSEKTPAAPDKATPPKKVDLEEGVYDLIHDLVTGKVEQNDVQAIRDRMSTLIDGTEKGDVTLRDAVAGTAAAAIEQEMRRAAPPKGRDGAIPPQAFQVMRSMAGRMAKELTRMLDGGLAAHEGNLLKEAVDFKVPEGYERAQWRVLGGFDYEEGMELPSVVTASNGKLVAVAGYMLALGDVTGIKEFLLVESQWSCCFGVPPELHQVLVVRLPKDSPGVDYTTAPVRVLGKLEVGEEVEEGFVTSVYRVAATKIDELEE